MIAGGMNIKRLVIFCSYLEKTGRGLKILNERNRICFSINGSKNDALVPRPNLLPAPPSPQNGLAALSFRDNAGIMCVSFMPCTGGILPIGFNMNTMISLSSKWICSTSPESSSINCTLLLRWLRAINEQY